MKQTTIFITCGATLAFTALALFRCAMARSANSIAGADGESGHNGRTIETNSRNFLADDRFSPDAFREELLK